MNRLLPRIFVAIAAYRDPDCRSTLASLFGKAARPERIVAGICWQARPESDADRHPLAGAEAWAARCRIIEVDARDSRGACWARHRTQALWQGEEFTLQIDSHMRFVADWDEVVLAMLAKCASPKPALSGYPPAFTPPDTIVSEVVTTAHAASFDTNGILSIGSAGIAPADAPDPPARNAFFSAGFCFADSRLIAEVPYDPHVYFHGEEITMAVRLWTHGWDIFAPNRIIAYHDYSNHPGRERHWNDNDTWEALNDRSFRRVRHLLGMEPSQDRDVTLELDRYGLGTERDIASFEAFAEVDFRRRLVRGKTAEQLEAEAPVDERRRKIETVFSEIWQSGSWSAENTRSGSGSTLAATEILRPKLVELFGFLAIDSLLDVGCGDLNWISEISGSLRFYFGIDVVPDILTMLRLKYHARANHFFDLRDVTLDDLPAADAILCRDVLTHFPDYAVHQALARIKASGARFLIATTHPSGDNPPIPWGGWRPLDLCAAPFHLPPPRILLREDNAGVGKGLGVWQIGALPEWPEGSV